MVSPLDAVAATGEQASWYLEGQLSVSLNDLVVGSSRRALLLDPDGLLVSPLAVQRSSDEEYLLLSPPGTYDSVKSRLERFRLRTKVNFELAFGGGISLYTFGDSSGASQAGNLVVEKIPYVASLDDLGTTQRPLREFVFRGQATEVQDLLSDFLASSNPELNRIIAGEPAWGREIRAGMNPTELGPVYIKARTDFNKGCYTGQELIERVDSRGYNTPKRFSCFIIFGQGESMDNESIVVTETGKTVATITSVQQVPRGNFSVGMGFIHRIGGEFRDEISFGNRTLAVVEPGRLLERLLELGSK